MGKWIAMIVFILAAGAGGLYYRHWKQEKDKKERIEKQLERQRLLSSGKAQGASAAAQKVADLEAQLAKAQAEGKMISAEELAKLKADLEAARAEAAKAQMPTASDAGTEMAAGDAGTAAPAPAPAPATP